MLFEWVAIVMEEDELSSAPIEAMPAPPSPPLTLHPRSTPLPAGKWVEVWLCEKINFLKFPVDHGIGQELRAYCSPRGAEGWNEKRVVLHTSLVVVVDVFVVSSRPCIHP